MWQFVTTELASEMARWKNHQSEVPRTYRDLGAVFDSHMTMVPHVNALSQSARYHIRNIGKIRRFLDCDSCEKIVHAFVTTRLDLNNALLAGLPGDTVAKLQKCQNIAARVVTRTRIRDHIKPVLMNLHWLPVEQRIQYKLLIQVYKALNGLAPEYIADLLQEYVPTRALRSAGAHLLLEPKTATRWGARASSKAAPGPVEHSAIIHKDSSFISEF